MWHNGATRKIGFIKEVDVVFLVQKKNVFVNKKMQN